MNKITNKNIIQFIIASIIYSLWVLWMESPLLFIGLIFLIDICLTKKIPWKFWKKYTGRKRKVFEWADALIFAIFFATIIKIFLFELYAIPTGSLEKSLLIGDRLIVSKVSYGPRLPNTPVYFPLVHNTLPMTKKTDSYLSNLEMPYKRLAGTGKIERYDYVTFNFPVGDTILNNHENPDYYTWIRHQDKEKLINQFGIRTHPVDRRENYVKRCVAVPGDTLEIIDGKVFVNGTPEPDFKGIQHNYLVTTNGRSINSYAFERLHILKKDIQQKENMYLLPLTKESFKSIKRMKNVVHVERYFHDNIPSIDVFPNHQDLNWSKDNFGPLFIPGRGITLQLSAENLPFYKRIIEVYEQNTLQVDDDDNIYINGKQTSEYTCKMNYYWMMGDNRDNSSDSRNWGFVPENHIVGKPVMVFFSWDKEKPLYKAFRWDRLLKVIDPGEVYSHR
jgi:signal peptidase I